MTAGTGDRMKRIQCAKIVDAIVADLCDRSGLQNEWEIIDEEIHTEIRQAWFDIIYASMTPKPHPQGAPRGDLCPNCSHLEDGLCNAGIPCFEGSAFAPKARPHVGRTKVVAPRARNRNLRQVRCS